MKTQTLQEKIMQQLMYFTITKMKHEKLLDKIMKAIQQEVRECIGEDDIFTGEDMFEKISLMLDNGKNMKELYEHRNILRSEIKEKLKEKGLL